MSDDDTHDGGCACGAVRYRMHGPPMFVHCCHCTWCQREAGSAFVINAIIETGRIEVTEGAPERIATPSESGAGQDIYRCPACHVALWSDYCGFKYDTRFLRAGTLDEPGRVPPDIQIFTESKQPWVRLNEDIVIVPVYYDRREVWPPESLDRLRAMRRYIAIYRQRRN